MKKTIVTAIAFGFLFSGATQVVGQPDISVTPDSLDADLFTGATTQRTLTVRNLGTSDLNWRLGIENRLAAAKGMAAPPLSLSNMMTEGVDATVIDPTKSSLRQGTDQIPQERPTISTSLAGTGSDSSILVIQNYSAWGVDMGSFIMNNFGIAATVINSSQIASTDFSPYDIVITVGSQDYTYYNHISSNVAKFESFVAAGGIVQYQAATQGDNVSIVNGVNVLFGHMEDVNRVVLPGNPIVAGLPTLLHGNYANHCYLSNLPPGAEIITVTDNSSTPTTVEYTYGKGRVIATGMTWEFLNYYNYDAGPMLYNALAYSLSLAGVSWLAASPTSGTVPAGSLINIDVTFDATGLNGGDYLANLFINSNDPDEPQVRVPAHLHVTGAPDITVTPDSINFGSVFVAYPKIDTVTVKNVGTDLLNVTSVSSNNSDFVPGIVSFSLAPGAQIKIPVTFTPGTPSPISGILTFTSNDPDMPSAGVALKGQGLIPPDIAVSPDSLDADLLTGAKEDQILTIRNLGGSVLNWTLDIMPADVLRTARYSLAVPFNRPSFGSVDRVTGGPNSPGIPLRTSAVQTTLLDLTGVKILFDQSHGNNPSYLWSIMIGDLQSRGATVTYNYSPITSAVLQDVDVFWLVDLYSFPLATSEITALHNWLIAGGGVLIEGDETIGAFNDFLASVGAGIAYTSLYSAYGITTNIFPHETTVGVDSIYIGNPLARLSTVTAPAAILVKDLAGDNNVAYSKVGNGRIIAMADENFVDGPVGAVDNELFGNQVFDWLAKAVGFVSVDIDNSAIASSDSAKITVTFDATGLNGGDYLADLLVKSNDPDESQVRVPAHLHVTGAPDISVSPDSVNFGSIFIGYTSSDTILVKNVGTDLLNVSNVSSSNADFVPGMVSLSLSPGAQIKVPVLFTPSASSPRSGILTFTSNDPDMPTAMVVLKGQGLIPPDIAVSPDSLDADLFSGEMVIETLTVSNTGGSDLIFDIATEGPVVLNISVQPLATKSVTMNTGLVGESEAGLSIWEANGLDEVTYRRNYPSGLAIANSDGVTLDPNGGAGLSASSSFPSATSFLEDFDRPDPWPWNPWVPVIAAGMTLTGCAHDGPKGISDPDWHYRTDITVGAPNDKLSLWVKPGSGRIYMGFGASAAGAWTLVAAPNTGELIIQQNAGYYFSNLASVSQTWTVGTWYKLEITFGNGAAVTGRVYASDGTTLLNTVSATLSGFIPGGVAIRSFDGFCGDTFESGIPWLSAAPTSGTVAAGSSTDIVVTFDATGLFGGDYLADLLVKSNDPDEPQVRVPAHLHVTGVPDIDVTPVSLAFGTCFVGTSHRDTIVVSNRGTDLLTVSNISTGSTHFSANPISFGLTPGSSQPVEVIFAPGTEGDLSTIMTITSNDPNEVVLTLPLHGRGAFPPEIRVSPDSISADIILSVNPIKTDTLTISNVGRSDLIWTTQFSKNSTLYTLNPPAESNSSRPALESGQNSGPKPPARTSPLQAVLDDLTGVKILFNGDFYYWSTMISDVQSRGASVAMSYSDFTDSLLSDVDILWLVDNSYYLSPAEIDALRNWLMAGGGLLLEADQSNDAFNTILSSLGAGITYASQNSAYGVTYEIYPHKTTAGVYSLYLSNPLARLSTIVVPAALLVRDIGGGNNVAYSKVGAGRIIAMADENFIDGVISSVDNELFGNQVFDWLASGVSWLTANPANGTTPAGMTKKIAVTINGSGLSSGDYSALIGIQSNDPLTPLQEVPVTMHVREYLCGDANADGVVNSADLNYIMQFYFFRGPATVPFQSGDVNCDSWINLSDISSLERFLHGTWILDCCQ